MQKKRIDEGLLERSLAKTRSEAKRLILEGFVLLNGSIVIKPSTPIEDSDVISIKERPKYVSRGGIKLEFALKKFNIDVKDFITADIGASTGGFTDCLLQHGARKVYAVDVGYGQLDLRLREDPRVTLIENTNARYIKKEQIPENLDLIVMDVSFISISKIVPHIKGFLKKDGQIVSLVKPQFEGERRFVKKGVVKDKELQEKIITNLIDKINQSGQQVTSITYSPIKGAKGNIEYFFLIKDSQVFVKPFDVHRIIEEIWEKQRLQK